MITNKSVTNSFSPRFLRQQHFYVTRDHLWAKNLAAKSIVGDWSQVQTT